MFNLKEINLDMKLVESLCIDNRGRTDLKK